MLTLGLLLHTLATLNFSLALFLGLAASPLAFVDRTPSSPGLAVAQYLLLILVSPVSAVAALAGYGAWLGGSPAAGAQTVLEVLARLSFGWHVWGSWGVLVGVCCVWWPAWVMGATLVAGSWYADDDGGGREAHSADAEVKKTQ
jgi:GPI-anchor transamidase subunit GAA1